jgi:F-type H+-transporting ATPase subunit delta
MKLSAKNLGLLLEREIAAASVEHRADIVRAFDQIVVEQGKSSKLEDLLRAFRIAYNKRHNEIDVTATVTDKEEAKVPHEINGKKVNLKIIEDKSIIGGIKIETDDFVVDNTVRTKLRALKELAR